MSYILIVDDDQMVAQTLSDMVTLLDWKTQVVNSPRAAIEFIRRKRPGLILLDLNMPGVDGLEVCRYIQREPSSSGTPVVFVTAEDDPGTRQRAKEAGAIAYLVKPVDFDSLEQILKKIPAPLTGTTMALKVQPPPPSLAVVATSKPAQTNPVQPPSSPSAAPVPATAKPASNVDAASAPPPAKPDAQPRPAITQPAKPSDQGASTAKKAESTERQ